MRLPRVAFDEGPLCGSSTSLASAYPRSLPSNKQSAPVSHFFSIRCGLSQSVENTAISSLAVSALPSGPGTAHSKGLIAPRILVQLLHLPHLRGLSESAHSE